MTKEKIEHKDILGQPLSENSYIAMTHRNTMHICQIKKITSKMIRVNPISKKYEKHGGWLIYPTDSVLLSGPDALAYILTHSAT